MPERVEIFAPAKINLFLHLVGRRDDGYHLIESVFAFAEDVGDQVTVALADEPSFSVSGPFAEDLALAGGMQDNLVLRARDWFFNRFALEERPVAIQLEKCLPIASGIGGGSADAAAMLRGLSQLCAQPLTAEDWQATAELGADIPACCDAIPKWVSGIGEKFDPISLDDGIAGILANPGFPVATGAIFQRFKEEGSKFDPAITVPRLNDLDRLLQNTHNTLESHAKALCPAIGETLDLLAQMPGCRLARMSGSGATCFALFDGREHAERAGRVFSQRVAEGWARPFNLAW